jgi:putative membrane protein
VVRPIVIVLTLPFTILTLGLFLLVVNGAMLALVAGLLPGFHIDGFGKAILAALIVSVTSWIASLIGPDPKVEAGASVYRRRG